MSLPSAGASISLFDVRTLFSSNFTSMESLYGVAPGVPTSGAIGLDRLFGAGPTTPSASLSVIPTVAVDTSGSAQSGQYSFGAIVSDTFGLPLKFYMAVSGSTLTSVSMNEANGVVSYSAPYNRWSASDSVRATACNRFQRSVTRTIPFQITGRFFLNSLGSRTIDGGTTYSATVSASENSSGLTPAFSVTGNPNGNAYMSGSTLNVPATGTRPPYTVTVTATLPGYAISRTTSLSVTERIPFATDYSGTFYSGDINQWLLIRGSSGETANSDTVTVSQMSSTVSVGGATYSHELFIGTTRYYAVRPSAGSSIAARRVSDDVTAQFNTVTADVTVKRGADIVYYFRGYDRRPVNLYSGFTVTSNTVVRCYASYDGSGDGRVFYGSFTVGDTYNYIEVW